MSNIFRGISRLEWIVLLSLTLLALLGAACLMLAMDHGPWAHSDSAAYLVSARNLAEGHGLGIERPSGAFIPTTGHPPFYQLIIAAQVLIGIPELTAARLINLITFIAGFCLFGSALLRVGWPKPLAVLSPVLIFFHPDILNIYVGAITEPLYFALSLGAISAALVGYSDGERSLLWWTSVILAGLAWLTRYAGLSTLLAVSMMWSLPISNGHWRYRTATKFLLLASLPQLAWLSWLWFGLGGTVPRSLNMGFRGLSERLQALRGALVERTWHWLPISSWLPEYPYRIQLFILMLLGLVLLCFFLFQIRARRLGDAEGKEPVHANTLAGAGIIFGATYLGILILTVGLTDPVPDLNTRVLSPLLVASLLVLVSLPLLLRNVVRRQYIVIVGFGVVFSLLCLSYLPPNVENIREMASRGRGYTSLSWERSETLEAVRELEANATLISSDPTALLFLLDRPAYNIPLPQPAPAPPEVKSVLEIDRSEPIDALIRGRGYLILFDSYYWVLHRTYGDDTDRVLETLVSGLDIFGRYDDGTIYWIR